MFASGLKNLLGISIFTAAVALPHQALANWVALRSDTPLSVEEQARIKERLSARFSPDGREALVDGDSTEVLNFAINAPKNVKLSLPNEKAPIFIPSLNFREAKNARPGVEPTQGHSMAELEISGNKLSLRNPHTRFNLVLEFSSAVESADFLTIPTKDSAGDICDASYMEVKNGNGAVHYFYPVVWRHASYSTSLSDARLVKNIYRYMNNGIPDNGIPSYPDKLCNVVHY